MSEDATLDEVDQTLADLLQPARDLDARLAAQEEQLKAQLAAIRAQRAKLRAALRALDPEAPQPGRPKLNGKATIAPPPQGKMVGEKNRQRFRELLLQHADEINANGGMNRTAMFELFGLPAANKTSFMYAMRIFHDEGFMLLDHTEARRGGPLAFYKVVTSG